MTKKPDTSSSASSDKLFIYGLDRATDRPQGARFASSNADEIRRAALSLKLNFHDDVTDDLKPLVARLPVGRLQNGKPIIPSIEKALYEKIVSAVASGQKQAEPRLAAGANAPAQNPAATTTKQPVLPPLASGLPQNWELIATGNMVLAMEAPAEGWWEAIVIARTDEILSLRYRDYPKAPIFERHVSTVALINPRPA